MKSRRTLIALVALVALVVVAALLWSVYRTNDGVRRDGDQLIAPVTSDADPESRDDRGSRVAGGGKSRDNAAADESGSAHDMDDGRAPAADWQSQRSGDSRADPDGGEATELGPLTLGLTRPAHVSITKGEVELATRAVDADGPPRVEVRVFDARTLQPLAGARVFLYQDRAAKVAGVTDDNGRIIVRHPGAGQYVVRIEAADRVPLVDDDVLIKADRSLLVEGRMEIGIPVIGTVVREEDGEPIEGARVRVLWWRSDGILEPYGEEEIGGRRTTDARGRFRFDAVPREVLASLEIDAPARGRVTEDIRVGSTEDYVARFELPPGASVRGVVRLPTGQPAPGATVILLDTSWWRDRNERSEKRDDQGLDAYLLSEFFAIEDPSPEDTLHAWTDATGNYRVDGLHAGVPYAIIALSPAHGCSVARSGIVACVDTETTVSDILLREFGRLVVSVVDANGDALTGAIVGGAYALRGSPKEGAAGVYVLDRADPVAHSETVRMPDGRGATYTAEVTPGSTAEVRVVVDEGHTLSGVVVDSQGEPVAGAALSVVGDGDSEATRRFRAVSQTEADGRFSIRGLPTGNYWGDVRCDGFAVSELHDLVVPSPELRVVLQRGGSVRVELSVPEGRTMPASVSMLETIVLEVSGIERQLWWPRDSREFAGGVLEFSGLSTGPQRLALDVPPYRAVIRELSVGLDEPTDLGRIELSPMLVFRGRLIDESGEPLPGAGFRCVDTLLRPSVGGDDPFTRVGADGRFRIEYAEPGQGILWVMAEDRASVAVAINVSEGQREEDITCPRGVLIQGIALDGAGEPLALNAVEMRPVVEPRRSLDVRCGALQTTRTGADGRFTIRMTPGIYEVRQRSWVMDVETVRVVEGEQLVIRRPR